MAGISCGRAVDDLGVVLPQVTTVHGALGEADHLHAPVAKVQRIGTSLACFKVFMFVGSVIFNWGLPYLCDLNHWFASCVILAGLFC